MKNNVSFRDLYQIIGDFRKENNDRFDGIEELFNSFHKEEFSPLKEKMDTLTGKIAVFGAGLMIGMNVLWDIIKEKVGLK